MPGGLKRKHMDKEGEMLRGARGVFGVMVFLGLILVISLGDATGATFRSPIEGDPINLDPSQLTHTQDRLVAEQVFEGLLSFDYAANPPYPVIPVLAKSYEVSKDAKTITFKLQQGVQFHGGYGEMTSEDVVFTLQRHLDPKVASAAKQELEDVDRIEAPDKYTVKIYLKVSSGLSLLRSLAFQNAGFVLSKKAVTNLEKKIERLPIGTGPFYFDQWSPGEKVILKKFSGYWRTPAKIDAIEFWVIPEEIVALGALEKGDLDLSSMTKLGSYQRAKAMKGIQIVEAKGGARAYTLYINNKIKPTDDLRVRKALAHALDIKGICERIGPQLAPFPSPFSPVVFSATDEFWKYDYNPEKAKQLLAEAGYPKGLELKVMYYNSDLFEPIVMEVQRSFKTANVELKLEYVEQAIWLKKFREFDAQLGMFSLARYVPYLYAEGYQTGAARNYSKYSNPETDELIKKAKSALTDDEARKYWREFQKKVTDEVVNFWVANGKSLVVIKNNVKGIVVMPTPGLYILKNVSIQ
jgi:peptide/nickel transport system substrate-binding protein